MKEKKRVKCFFHIHLKVLFVIFFSKKQFMRGRKYSIVEFLIQNLVEQKYLNVMFAMVVS